MPHDRERHSPFTTMRRLTAVLALTCSAGAAMARQAVPPADPPKDPTDAAATKEEPKQEKFGPGNRRVLDGPATVLAFKNVTVEQLIPFISEATGKVVMPQQDVLTRRVTIVNDRPIPRQQALDFVFLALQQGGIGVVETDDLVTLRDLAEVGKAGGVQVVGPDESLQARTDPGVIIEKVFALRHATAENMGTILKDSLPDYAKMTVDKESNQVVIMGNVGLLKRLERVISSLDQPAAASLVTETFRLRYADAEQVAQNIKELYSADSRTTGGGGGGNNQNRNPFQQLFGGGGGGGGGNRGQGGGGGGGGGGAGGANRQSQASDASATSANLRATANTHQNSVTVLAERQVIEQIRELIDNSWDKELPRDQVKPKVYDLQNSDPVKVRDLLEGLFGRGTSTTTGTGGQNSSSAANQGVGRLQGQFSFQAIPESGRLVVVSRTPDNIKVIDEIIADLDKPQSVGIPQIIELKHANAEELAEQLNTLLAQDGTLAQIRRQQSGLTAGTSTASPFATTETTGATQNANQQTQGGTTTTADNLQFWWQRSRPPTDKRGASNLIGAIRLVPVWRQNALMVIAPPEYSTAVAQMISQLDRPGRQVLISAIILEISTGDATSLGLRWGSGAFNPARSDNALNIAPIPPSTQTITGTKNDFLTALFDTSVLAIGTDLNVLIQALNEKTDVNILSEPRVFTSDNQEAEFFDGQDIPFVTDSQVNTQGNITQSFDYRAVGIQLRCRPRITINRDVDLNVNVQLASLAPGGQTSAGGFIVDRRETTTQLIVKDGQTIVISGLRRKENTDIVRKVPILGDIPLLGLLFRSTEKELRDSELLMFITPVVVENETERERMNDPYQRRLEELRNELKEPDVSHMRQFEEKEKQPDSPAPTDAPTTPESGSANKGS